MRSIGRPDYLPYSAVIKYTQKNTPCRLMNVSIALRPAHFIAEFQSGISIERLKLSNFHGGAYRTLKELTLLNQPRCSEDYWTGSGRCTAAPKANTRKLILSS